MSLNRTSQSIFLLEFIDLDNSGKQLKPLLPSCFLFIQDLSRYFDAGLIQFSKDLIFLKIISIWLLKFFSTVVHLSIAKTLLMLRIPRKNRKVSD